LVLLFFLFHPNSLCFSPAGSRRRGGRGRGAAPGLDCRNKRKIRKVGKEWAMMGRGRAGYLDDEFCEESLI
jgi:hypothetical protein